ncbi:Tho complex subunit 7 domain containing protein [Russula decolorans]
MVSNISPLPPDEEDAIIHSRITNDERALRRVVKKFSNYTTVAYSQADPPGSDQSSSAVEDAREAFLLELSSFSLQLKKAVMVCEAEAWQVEEYYREKQRIEDERGSLKGQIEQLKTFLEHAQVERRRKIEYDSFAEKINTLPCRAELERSIQLLENDMAAIRADQEAQSRHLQTQRASLVSIISDLGSLKLMTKDTEGEPSHPGTPDPDAVTSEADASRSSLAAVAANEESDREEGEAEEVEKRQEDGQSSDDVPLSIALNSRARITLPSPNSAPIIEPGRLTRSHFNPIGSAPPSIVIHDLPSNSDDDIEMGELAEEREPVRGKKRLRLRREDLEEGEASDESSELSDPPDD